jgi:hypothetical protein
VILAARWAVNADPAVLARIIKGLAIIVAAAALLLLIWRGTLGLVLMLLAMALPIYLRWRTRRQRERAAAGPATGNASNLRTATLDMTLEHGSGQLDGTVRAGPQQGSRLSAMTLPQLLALLAACRTEDPESVPVLEAFLDRNFGADWRAQADAGPAGSEAGGARAGAMSREEAYEVLGLKPGAAEAEIREAHHRLMLKVHPDHGGSTYLAARLNEARDLLLEK